MNIGKQVGAPLIEINWDQFEALCKMQATQKEIAGIFKISREALRYKVMEKYEMTYKNAFEMLSAEGKLSIRRKQFQVANNGNVQMLKWLGIQYLDQSQKVEQKVVEEDLFEKGKDLEDMTDQELIDLAKEEGLDISDLVPEGTDISEFIKTHDQETCKKEGEDD